MTSIFFQDDKLSLTIRQDCISEKGSKRKRMITLVFAILTFALLVKLNQIIGLRVGFKIEKESLRDPAQGSSEIREVSGEEKTLRTICSSYPNFDPDIFLKKAEKVFEMVRIPDGSSCHHPQFRQQLRPGR